MQHADLDMVFSLLTEEVSDYKEPYVELLAQNNDTPFKILIATLLSARSKDRVTAEAARRLFSCAQSPHEMKKLSEERIAELIYPVGFYRNKSRMIVELTDTLISRFDAVVPDSIDDLVTLQGVGRKTANLVINLAFKKKGICVDTHVHRIVNRWGLVLTATASETEMLLRNILPLKYWVPINRLLVLYGQHVCTPTSPKCSLCKLCKYCDKKGVLKSR